MPSIQVTEPVGSIAVEREESVLRIRQVELYPNQIGVDEHVITVPVVLVPAMAEAIDALMEADDGNA